MNQIPLGTEVKDVVTGFTGIVTARVNYLSGCIQYGVSAKVDKENKIPATEFFDEDRLETVSRGVAKETVQIPKGGPQRDCPGR